MLRLSKMDHQDLADLLPAAGDRLRFYEPMSQHTTFRIGGFADIYFEPESEAEIQQAIRYSQAHALPCTVLGNGSNILVSDQGIRGLVLAFGEPDADIRCEGSLIVARAGARLAAVAAFAARCGLSGLEFASGIPGTLGGAILMNAGAYDACMADVVVQTDFLNEKMDHRQAMGDEHCFGYRTSYFLKNASIILGAAMQLKADQTEDILRRMADLAARRRASQPLDLPSAGSVFKRPTGFYAGKLISECGLQGLRFGDAQVSEKHAGFIVNRGQATAHDVRSLMVHIQERVAAEKGVHLEPEIRMIGEWTGWDDRPDTRVQ